MINVGFNVLGYLADVCIRDIHQRVDSNTDTATVTRLTRDIPRRVGEKH